MFQKQLTIFHVNDSHEYLANEQKDVVGGAARFITKLNESLSKEKGKSKYSPIVLHSGDMLSPSMLSQFFEAKYSIDPLNQCSITATTVGNHDLDFTLERFLELKNKLNFPWVLSNLKLQNKQIGLEYLIIHNNDLKIGLIGLLEKEWLPDVKFKEKNDLVYEDFAECSNRLGYKLKYEENCDIIIALTHMRNERDLKLAQKAQYVDLILGGHDHIIYRQVENNILIVKSGSDFQYFSKIIINFEKSNYRKNKKYDVFSTKLGKILIKTVNITKDIQPFYETDQQLQVYMNEIEEMLNQVVGYFQKPLDATFKFIRTNESDLGQFFANLFRIEEDADLCILNTGVFRSDRILEQGILYLKQLYELLPMIDYIVLVEVSGKTIHYWLENAVSCYHSFEGKFCNYSGIAFECNLKESPMKRISKNKIWINNELIDYDRKYKLATKEFLAKGCDGFSYILDQKILNQNTKKSMIEIVKHFFSLTKEDIENSQNQKSLKYKELISDFMEINNKEYVCISPDVIPQVKFYQ